MNLKKELVRIALIGTQRSVVSDELSEALALLGIDQSRTIEEQILDAVAMLSKMEKAGFPLQVFKGDLAETCKDHSEQVCSIESIQHLQMIIEGGQEAALPEFLFNLAKNKKCLPPEVLPELLDQSLSSAALWEQLQKSIGERAYWLIRMNPDWHRLIAEAPQQIDLEEATGQERLAILSEIRAKKPEEALAFIKETWSSESVTNKVKLLKILEQKLSKKDEAFLESCLDDRRKEVRRNAVQVLAQLPEAALLDRMFDRLKTLIQIKKRPIAKNKLQIQLPDIIDENMIRDGIDPRVQWYKGGVKASRLGQMIALIPPSYWSAYFSLSPTGVVDLFVRSEWGELMIQATVEATALHREREWIAALLDFRLESADRQRWQSLNVKPLIDIIDDKTFNKVAIKGMKQLHGLLEESSPLTYMLKTCTCIWEDELTQLVIKNLQDWLAGENSRYWNGWHYRSILKKAAYTINPFLHEKLAADWPEESNIWSSWEREIIDFITTLQFRKKMIASLRDTASPLDTGLTPL